MGILLIVMIAMAYLYFSNLNKRSEANDLSLNVVSANAGLIFCFDHDKSFYEILSGQDLFQRVLGETKSDQLASIRKQMLEKPELAELLVQQKIYIGFLPGKNSQIDYLIGTQLKQSINLQQFLANYLPKEIKTTQLKDVVKLHFSDSTVAYMGIKDKLVVLSDASEQIQKIIGTAPPKASNFANYIKENIGLSKNSLASVYLNFEVLPSLLKNTLNSSISGELSVFNQKGTYATLNYNFSSEKLLFNGTTTLGNEFSYYTLFDHMPDQKLVINNLLTKTTANYTIYAVADYKNWFIDLSKWLGKQKGNERILRNEEMISKKYGLDLKQIFPVFFQIS